MTGLESQCQWDGSLVSWRDWRISGVWSGVDGRSGDKSCTGWCHWQSMLYALSHLYWK